MKESRFDSRQRTISVCSTTPWQLPGPTGPHTNDLWNAQSELCLWRVSGLMKINSTVNCPEYPERHTAERANVYIYTHTHTHKHLALCKLFPGVKWPGLEAGQSPPCSAEVKNVCIYSSVSLYAFIAWTGTLHWCFYPRRRPENEGKHSHPIS